MPITDKERAIIDFYLHRGKKTFADCVNLIYQHFPEKEEELNELIYRGKKKENEEGYDFLNKGKFKTEFYKRFILCHKDLCNNANVIHQREKSINRINRRIDKKSNEEEKED